MTINRPQIKEIVLNDQLNERIDIETSFFINDVEYCRIAIAWGKTGYEVFRNKKVQIENPVYIENNTALTFSESEFEEHAKGRLVKYCVLCRTVSSKDERYIYEFYLSDTEGCPFDITMFPTTTRWYSVSKLTLYLQGTHSINPIEKHVDAIEGNDGFIVGLFFVNNTVDSVEVNLAAHYERKCKENNCVKIRGAGLKAEWEGYLLDGEKITSLGLKRFWQEKKSKYLVSLPMIAMTKHDRSPSGKFDSLNFSNSKSDGYFEREDKFVSLDFI